MKRAPWILSIAAVLLAMAPRAHAAFDAQKEWSAFLAGSTTYDQVNEAFHALGEVHYNVESVDAAACGGARATLDAALQRVPVSLALHHAAMLCAEALHDATSGETHMDAIAALTRHAIAESGDGAGAWTRPLRVVRPEDVLAFAAAAGYDSGYGYFEQVRATDVYPLTQVVIDRDTHRERHFRFDWVDTLARLKSDSDFAGYPRDREIIAAAFVDNWAGDDDIAWVDARALRAASQADDRDAARDVLRGAAARGGLMSIHSWMEACRTAPRPHCADGLVDALLPLAEHGDALPRVLLALAYDDGIGIARDPAAARTLLESADASWEGHGAALFFASVLLAREAAWPAWLQARLEASSSVPAVRALLAVRSVASHRDTPPAGDIALLESPSNNRTGRGLYVLSQLPHGPRSDTWLAGAAEAGSVQARRERGLALVRADSRDVEGLALVRAAAMGGDLPSTHYMAYRAATQGQWHDAERWWIGTAMSGDLDSLSALASLYAAQYPGIGGDAPRAYRMYEAMSGTGPAVRREFAGFLLTNRFVPHEPARARGILEADAAAGDVDSQIALAQAYAQGLFGAPAPEDARIWFEKALVSGKAASKAAYGMWLYGHETSIDARRRGLAMLLEAADADDANAMNNLAWARCVTPVGELRDARAGLAMAARMGPVDTMPAGRIDTVAACRAANGEFAKAVELQAMAIAQVVTMSGEAAASEMRKRLYLYRAGWAYVEPAK